jgi:ankyrin repeat protein
MGSKALEIMNILINKGADINQKESIHNRTLMHHAAQYGPIDLVKLLIGKGAKLEEYNASWTPLHMASIVATYTPTGYDNSVENAYEILELLLAAGADPNKGKEANGETDTPLKVVQEKAIEGPNKEKVILRLREAIKAK